MSLYNATVTPMTKQLEQLDKWLEAGIAYAKQKNFEPNVLATARLAPDQYPLIRQVQAACDAAKTLGARLAGKEPPKHPDTEQTIDELRTRIKTCTDYMKTVKESEFAGAETRMVPLPFMPGKGMVGMDYVCELAIPNFYFHIAHAYAILRHNGVPLGKMDYIGSLNLKDV
jgi:hypothetical protein